MAEVKVLLFGPLAETFGFPESNQNIDENSTPNIVLQQMGLLDWKKKGLRCAINQEFCSFEKKLEDGDEIAFLTPVFALLSGGIWLNERLTFVQWIGVGFVLISVFFVSQRKLIWELNNTDSTL